MPLAPITIRRAALPDLDFLLEIDLLGEGYTPNPEEQPFTAQERQEYRERLSAFVSDPAEAGLGSGRCSNRAAGWPGDGSLPRSLPRATQ